MSVRNWTVCIGGSGWLIECVSVTEQVNHVLLARDVLSEALYKYSCFT